MPDIPDSRKNAHREYAWPIGIAAVLLLFVLILFSLIVFASLQSRDLVENDYYDEGLAYENRIEQVERTRASAIPVTVTLDPATRELTLTLPADLVQADDLDGTVQLYRPSNAAWDRKFPLTLDAASQQVIDTPGVPMGLWRVKLAWINAGQSYYYEETAYLP